MPDAWRAYLELALGLTEAPRKKAEKAVTDLVSRGGATAGQLQGLVSDLLSAGVANREALTNIVRFEVDKALGVVGLATADEVGELTSRVRDLEQQLRAAQARAVAAEGGAEATVSPGAGIGGTRLDQPAPTPRKVAKKAVAKKAVKVTPNKMPTAGTKPASPSANTGRATTEPVIAPSATPADNGTAPAKKAVKKAIAKKAVAKSAAAAKSAEPSTPAGTVEAPVAPVKQAAAATELPPVRSAPAKSAPAKSAPAKSVPAKSVPAKSAAAKSAPAKSAPAKSAPAKSAPAKSAPGTAAPAQAAPVKATPSPSVPARKSAAKAAPSTIAAKRAPAKKAAKKAAPKTPEA